MGVTLRQIETRPCGSSECDNSDESVVSVETGDSGKSFVIVLYGMSCIDTDRRDTGAGPGENWHWHTIA